ncbi:YhdP family protein [Nautilia lithotrophica]
MQFNAILKPSTNYSYVNFEYITLKKPELKLKNTIINIYFKPAEIFIKGKGELNNNKFNLSINLFKNNTLKAHLTSDKIIYSNDLINTTLKNIEALININLNYMFYELNTKFKKADIKYQNHYFKLENSSIKLTNNDIKFQTNSIYIPNYQNIKNVKIEHLTGSYNIRNRFLILSAPKIYANYQHYKLISFRSNLVYNNIHNFNLTSQKITILQNKNRLNLYNNLLNIFKNYTFLSVNNGEFISQNIKLKSSKIIGDLINFYIPKIYGEVYGFKTSINEIKINSKNKTLHAKEAVYNNVKAYNILFKNNTLSLQSNNLFDKNIKEILKKFLDIDIPVLQIAGKNKIISTIKINKNIQSLTNVITTTSLLKLFNFDLFVPQAEINITNNNLNFKTNNTDLFLTKDIKLRFSGDGIIDFKQSNLKMNGIINFKIDRIIELKDYNESAEIDFNTQTLKAKNSNVFMDFSKNELIINPLKNILAFTSFKPFVNNGILLITFGNTTDITTYLLLKLPILYKHSNTPIINTSYNLIKHIFLNIVIGHNIKIFNKNVDIQIDDNKINAKLNAVDINLFPLEKLLNNNSGNNDFNYSITLYTNNANLIYKTHKFLSQHATISYKKNKLKFQSIYKKSSVIGYTKQGYLLLEGKNFTNEEFKAFLPKFNFFSLINLDFILVKSPDEFYSGKIYINRAIVRELKSLNNVIAFINTIPSLLSFSSPGFSSKGYKIKNGYINYLLYKKILYIKEAKIEGDNLDFHAKGYIDFNKNYMFLKVQANMKMKLKKIPIIGKGLSYLLFGKDGSIDVKMIVKGDLNNPKVKEDIGKEILLSPFNLFKRAITLPFNIF